MSYPNANPKRHVWEQWEWVWPAVAYGLLGLHAVIAWDNDLRNGPVGWILALTGLLAVWYAPLVRGRRLPGTLPYHLLGWIMWTGLIYLHPAALMLAGLFYLSLFLRLPIRQAIASAGVLTVVVFVVALATFNPDVVWLPSLLIFAGLLLTAATVIGLFINALIEQSHARQRLVDELTQTRADLARAEREAGTLAERQRLAREIHDTLAQDFTSIVMHLTAARLNPATADPHLQQAEQTAREGLNEARHLVWALQPERASLAQSIEQLATRWGTANPARVQFTVTGTPAPMLPEKEGALLRAAQEALTNIQKHARAHFVTLTLSYMKGMVALDVADDGCGFDPAGVVPDLGSGYGLKAMRERVEALGGTLTVESQPGKGTALAVALPV